MSDNRQRAQRAQRTLDAYSAAYDDGDGGANASADLLADLMHLHGDRFAEVLRLAARHYEAEVRHD